jgi:hypothetical protein
MYQYSALTGKLQDVMGNMHPLVLRVIFSLFRAIAEV